MKRFNKGILWEHTAKRVKTTRNDVKAELDQSASSHDDPVDLRNHTKVRTNVLERIKMLGRALLVALTRKRPDSAHLACR